MTATTETRRWGRRDPIATIERTVTVEFTADITHFVESINTAAAAFARFAEVWTPHSRAIQFIRSTADDERAEAHDWLNARLDHAYAELHLPRDPHIHRGEN